MRVGRYSVPPIAAYDVHSSAFAKRPPVSVSTLCHPLFWQSFAFGAFPLPAAADPAARPKAARMAARTKTVRRLITLKIVGRCDPGIYHPGGGSPSTDQRLLTRSKGQEAQASAEPAAARGARTAGWRTRSSPRPGEDRAPPLLVRKSSLSVTLGGSVIGRQMGSVALSRIG